MELGVSPTSMVEINEIVGIRPELQKLHSIMMN